MLGAEHAEPSPGASCGSALPCHMVLVTQMLVHCVPPQNRSARSGAAHTSLVCVCVLCVPHTCCRPVCPSSSKFGGVRQDLARIRWSSARFDLCWPELAAFLPDSVRFGRIMWADFD